MLLPIPRFYALVGFYDTQRKRRGSRESFPGLYAYLIIRKKVLESVLNEMQIVVYKNKYKRVKRA